MVNNSWQWNSEFVFSISPSILHYFMNFDYPSIPLNLLFQLAMLVFEINGLMKNSKFPSYCSSSPSYFFWFLLLLKIRILPLFLSNCILAPFLLFSLIFHPHLLQQPIKTFLALSTFNSFSFLFPPIRILLSFFSFFIFD